MVENIVAVVHIYGAIATFLLFCDHQDTEFKSSKMKIGVFQPICTHKNAK